MSVDQAKLQEIFNYVTAALKVVSGDEKLRYQEGLEKELVDWAEVRCQDVIACRNMDDEQWIQVVVTDAAPDAQIFRFYLFEALCNYFLDLQFEICLKGL